MKSLLTQCITFLHALVAVEKSIGKFLIRIGRLVILNFGATRGLRLRICYELLSFYRSVSGAIAKCRVRTHVAHGTLPLCLSASTSHGVANTEWSVIRTGISLVLLVY